MATTATSPATQGRPRCAGGSGVALRARCGRTLALGAIAVLSAAALSMATAPTATAEPAAPPSGATAGAAGEEAAASAALDWIERELVANGGTLPGFSPDTTDWGLTGDAALALLAHDRDGDPTTSDAVDAMLAGLADYTTWDSLGASFAGVRLAGPLAKLLLVAEEAGRPTTVGAVELESELRSLMAASGPSKGRFGDRNPHGADAANAIGQALAVLALSHSTAGAPADAVQYLLDRQCPAGGFPLQTGTGPCTDDTTADPDATALVVEALLTVPRSATVIGTAVNSSLSAALAWLLARADPSTGAFGGTGPTAGLNANSTGLIAHALLSAGQGTSAGRAAEWIIAELQLGSGEITGTPAEPDLGAIAYSPATRATAIGSGIDSLSRDQWRRSTTQAALGLGAEPLGLAPEGDPVEPATTTTTTTGAPGPTTSAPSTAEAPTTTTTTPAASTISSGSTTPAQVAAAVASATGSGEQLAVTGNDPAATALVGAALVLIGAGSVSLASQWARRRSDHR